MLAASTKVPRFPRTTTSSVRPRPSFECRTAAFARAVFSSESPATRREPDDEWSRCRRGRPAAAPGSVRLQLGADHSLAHQRRLEVITVPREDQPPWPPAPERIRRSPSIRYVAACSVPNIVTKTVLSPSKASLSNKQSSPPYSPLMEEPHPVKTKAREPATDKRNSLDMRMVSLLDVVDGILVLGGTRVAPCYFEIPSVVTFSSFQLLAAEGGDASAARPAGRSGSPFRQPMASRQPSCARQNPC